MSSNEQRHIVKSYEQELDQLRDLLARMGGLVEAQTSHAVNAMLFRDAVDAASAMEGDVAVDALEREIEQLAIRLLALRSPMAQDLRGIVAALKISGDLERIGDYAANVAKRSMRIDAVNPAMASGGMRSLARLVQESLKLAVDAVNNNDASIALEVWRADRAVDDLYTAMFRELITYMMEDPRSITASTHMLFIAKNLERIGDHATNIAERVHYAVTGDMLPAERPRGQTPVRDGE